MTNLGTITVKAQEILTEKDCEEIIWADGHSVAYGGVESQLSAETARCMGLFRSSLRLAESLRSSPELRESLRNGLLQSVQGLGKEGYFTMYAVYTTAEQKRGCAIAFWPADVPHNGEFEVPCRLADLLTQHFVPRGSGQR